MSVAPRRLLVTGAAGFIGFHLSTLLTGRGDSVVGIDNLSDYYDVSLKRARLRELSGRSGFSFEQIDLADTAAMQALFRDGHFDGVVNLAAQPGVRYSLENPHAYVSSNITGFLNVLEGCRAHGTGHLVYASSSSVYGANTSMPFRESDNVDHPISLYGATKKSNELMAHCYSHLFRIPVTGLRFFTVYGPWGRPDMAPFLFTSAIVEGRPINVFNHGRMQRDFTFVGDVVEGIARVLDRVPEPNQGWNGENPDPATSTAPYRIYNIGNHSPVDLLDFIHVLEEELGRKAILNLLPMQPGDVLATAADVEALTADTGFHPSTPIRDGVRAFIAWYREYYGV